MLIFVQSKERAKQLYQELLYDNLTVDQLHSDMTSKQRLESVARMRRGETWVMVCTEVMARGMDFGGIKGVVNYDFPTTVQGYVHRIGKAKVRIFKWHSNPSLVWQVVLAEQDVPVWPLLTSRTRTYPSFVQSPR